MRAFAVCVAALAVCAFDAQGERLEFSCNDGSMRGLYFGLERAEEQNFDDIRQKTVTWSGVTRDTLVMRGRIERGSLYLTCTSTAHLCPDKVMMFRKGKW